MQLVKLSLFGLLSSYVAAQDIDNNDVPSECRSICASVISLTTTCDAQNDDDDSGFINCVCSAQNAATEIPACEACVANFDTNDGNDNDVNDLIRSCSFTTTSYKGLDTTILSGTRTATAISTATGQRPVTRSSTTRSASRNTASATAAGTGTAMPRYTPSTTTSSGASQALSSLSSVVSSLSSVAAEATETPNAGHADGVRAGVGVAALLVGVMGLV